MEKTFSVGVGKEIITPEIGGYLTGFSPLRRSDSVHDDLNIVVFILEQEEKKVLFAAMDTCNLGDESDSIRRAMSEAAGVPFEYTFISATHNHSGPVVYTKPPAMGPNPEYVFRFLIPKAAAAAKKAADSMKKAEMGIAVVESDVGINRRHLNEDGTISLGQEPLFANDREMTVIAFRDYEGKSIGNIVHYGCHNTACGPFFSITRDWCGVMKDQMEALSGGITAFFNGGEGDCGPRLLSGDTTGNMDDVLYIGKIAAADACKAYRSITAWQRDPELRTVTGSIEIPYEETPTIEGLRARIKEIEDKGENASLFEIAALKRYKIELEKLERGEKIDSADVISAAAFRLGEFAFMPSPFELFSRTVMRIKRHSPFSHTLPLSVTNGRGGYLPTEDQIPLGGYEVEAGYYLRTRRYVKNGEQYFFAGAVRLLRELDK